MAMIYNTVHCRTFSCPFIPNFWIKGFIYIDVLPKAICLPDCAQSLQNRGEEDPHYRLPSLARVAALTVILRFFFFYIF